MSYRYDGRAAVSNIYEVAKRAGVSTATVSRVLSQPDLVTPDTRRKVMQAVEFLDYAPNSAAKNLRTLRTGKLLVTVPDISNPFFSLILQGIEDAAQREGYAVLLGDTQHDEEREDRYALMLKRKEADGLIVLGHRLPKEAAALVRAMAPRCAPVVNGCEFTPQPRHPERAHRQRARRPPRRWTISIVSATGTSASSPARWSARSAAIACAARPRARSSRSAERDFVVTNGDFSIESGAAGAERLLGRREPPTAIFCFNDEMAMGAVETAKRRGLRVPLDVSIVGFDDIRFARCIDPPLTTVAQPMRAIGEGTVRAAARDPGERREGARLDHPAAHADDPLEHRAAARPRPRPLRHADRRTSGRPGQLQADRVRQPV